MYIHVTTYLFLQTTGFYLKSLLFDRGLKDLIEKLEIELLKTEMGIWREGKNRIKLYTVESPVCLRRTMEEESPCNAEDKSEGEGDQTQYSPIHYVSTEYGY